MRDLLLAPSRRARYRRAPRLAPHYTAARCVVLSLRREIRHRHWSAHCVIKAPFKPPYVAITPSGPIGRARCHSLSQSKAPGRLGFMRSSRSPTSLSHHRGRRSDTAVCLERVLGDHTAEDHGRKQRRPWGDCSTRREGAAKFDVSRYGHRISGGGGDPARRRRVDHKLPSGGVRSLCAAALVATYVRFPGSARALPPD